MSWNPVGWIQDKAESIGNGVQRGWDSAVTKSASAGSKTGWDAAPAANVSSKDQGITVVDLNAAMGLDHGRDQTNGTDFNDADMNTLVGDLFNDGRNPDVITMQEVALKGATGTSAKNEPDIGDLKGIQQRLEERTGCKWKMYFGNAGYQNNAGSPQDPEYFRSENGKKDGAGTRSPAGSVIFVREGAGVVASQSITQDTALKDDGVRLKSDKNLPGTLAGVRLTTAGGKELDVYTTHIAGIDYGATVQNQQIDSVRNEIKARSGGRPVILTGDFNAPVESRQSLRDLTGADGFRDASSGAGNTANKFGWYWSKYDHMFICGLVGLPVTGNIYQYPNPTATAFEANASDHKGLVMTVDPANLPKSGMF
jgi:hypothetical protein